ncbi:MAG: hypothetical protein NTZ71_15995 [Planctomycetota bacterium]|nr:hypothetical protein [Planctomycetota bacterium]
MVEDIRKLAIGFRLVFKGMIVLVVGVVVGLIPALYAQTEPQRRNMSVESMSLLMVMLTVVMYACMLVGYLFLILGRYQCSMTPKIVQKARANIRASFVLEIVAFVINITGVLSQYLLPAFFSMSIIPDLSKNVAVFNIVFFFMGFVLSIVSNLYFVMYMRDLAAFVGNDDLSLRSKSIIPTLQYVIFIACVVAVAMLVSVRILHPYHVSLDTLLKLPFGLIAFGCLFGVICGSPALIATGGLGFVLVLLYIAPLALCFSIFFRYVSTVIAMPAVLKAYNGHSDTHENLSEKPEKHFYEFPKCFLVTSHRDVSAMVKSISKLALGFRLVYMGMLVIVIGVVVGLVCGFALPLAVEAWNIPIKSILQITAPVAMGACMLLGYFLGIIGRYLCTLTPEIAQKVRSDIRTSFALEMLAFILNMTTSLWPYLLPTLTSIGILPESTALVAGVNSIIFVIGFIVGISSILYFVMYIRDLAGFVGSDDLSMRSENLRRSIVSLLQLSFVASAMAVAMLIVGLMANPDLIIVFGYMGCALGLLYVAILLLSISVFFRYVRIVVAMPAVLNSYDGPTDTQDAPSR